MFLWVIVWTLFYGLDMVYVSGSISTVDLTVIIIFQVLWLIYFGVRDIVGKIKE